MPARTKDKKKIHDEEVEVHIAWQSCLYITNFPPSYDQNQVEALFAPVSGFDLRIKTDLLKMKLPVWPHL